MLPFTLMQVPDANNAGDGTAVRGIHSLLEVATDLGKKGKSPPRKRKRKAGSNKASAVCSDEQTGGYLQNLQTDGAVNDVNDSSQNLSHSSRTSSSFNMNMLSNQAAQVLKNNNMFVLQRLF